MHKIPWIIVIDIIIAINTRNDRDIFLSPYRPFLASVTSSGLHPSGSDGLPVDRRHHDPAAWGGLGPSSGAARRGLFPDTRRSLDQLGGGHEGTLGLVVCLSLSYKYFRCVSSQVFEEFLLDADYSLNAGNWMWLSASAFFHKYTRIFCPVRFGRRTDPQGHYLRYHWTRYFNGLICHAHFCLIFMMFCVWSVTPTAV